MSYLFNIHPQNPQPRLIREVVGLLSEKKLMIYPSDTGYAFACQLTDKRSLEKIRTIRQLSDKHHFALICHNLSQLGTYARLNNQDFRLIKSLIPGPYTFVLNATAEVPKRLQSPKKRTVGIRVPQSTIALQILEQLGQPLLNSTLILPNEEYRLTDPYEIRQQLAYRVDIIIDAGYGVDAQTTLIDLSDDNLEILRQGAGEFKR